MAPVPASIPMPIIPDLGVGPGFEGFRQSLTKRLTLKSSTSTFATTNQSSHNEALLTPPLTHTSFDLPPFKAPESDKTSLSMKSHHSDSNHCRRLNRACLSSGDVDESPLMKYSRHHHSRISSRSKSLPILARMYDISPKDHITKGGKPLQISACNTSGEVDLAGRRHSLPRHSRRWTMPSKAAPTRVLTEMTPCAVLGPSSPTLKTKRKQRNHRELASDSTGSLETPAMITLQKATGDFPGRMSLRPDAYTSFPSPTFTPTRSSFLSTFLSNGWQKDNSGAILTSVEAVSVASHTVASLSSSRRASIADDGVNPPHCTTAGPVCTEVVMAPFRQSLLDSPPKMQSGTRRCSTKYVSGASMFEIIWDENISTSSSTSPTDSADISRRISMRDNERRHSVAMDKLETQMFKGIKQSRKASLASKNGIAAAVSSSVRRQDQRISFQNLLNFNFNNPTDDPSKSLPRSRNSTTGRNPTFHIPEYEVQLTTIDDDDDFSTTNMDFIPPRSQKCQGVSNDPLLENPWRKSWETRSGAKASEGLEHVDDSSRTETCRNTGKSLPRVMSEENISQASAVPKRRGSMLGHHTGMRKKSSQKKKLQTSRLGLASRKSSKQDSERTPLLGLFNDYHYGPGSAFEQ